MRPRLTTRQNATVLITAMWIVLVLAGMTLTLARAMRVETAASANFVAAREAEAAARGALEYVLATIAADAATATDAEAEDIAVGRARFWILRADPDEDGYTFGIADEAGKINLNSASQDMLLKIPGMTTELAAAVIDWRDEDSEVSPGGAEAEHYLLLADPYDCKNAEFETVDEILLVKGAELAMLTGRDANRNGVVEARESAAMQGGGEFDSGFYDYLTVYSRERNVDADGEDRVNVNATSTQELSDVLRDVVPDDRFFPMMDRIRRRRPFGNLIEFYFEAELEHDEFTEVADKLTVETGQALVGRINVNTAPRRVLLCLPELDESDADALIEYRNGNESQTESIAWVVEALPREKAIAIGGHITTRSFQFSADIVALSENGRGWKRRLAVVDIRGEGRPRVLLWKDLSHLGWPLDPGILEEARASDT